MCAQAYNLTFKSVNSRFLLCVTDVCNHPKDTGSCEKVISKWYYDRATARCQEFTFGGCDGSGNRFSSVEECESVCVKLVEPAPAAGNDTTVPHTGEFGN